MVFVSSHSSSLCVCVCLLWVHFLVCACMSLMDTLFFCSLLLGLVCPLLWYYATFLYLRKYYHKDPRERDGLAANAVAVSVTTLKQFNMMSMNVNKFLGCIARQLNFHL